MPPISGEQTYRLPNSLLFVGLLRGEQFLNGFWYANLRGHSYSLIRPLTTDPSRPDP
jgi:hypothetical protein